MSYVYVIHMKWYPSLYVYVLGCSNQLQVAQEQVLVRVCTLAQATIGCASYSYWEINCVWVETFCKQIVCIVLSG